MQFKLTSLVLLAYAATGLFASPLEIRDDSTETSTSGNYVEVYREAASLGNGSLVYYSLESPTNMIHAEPDAVLEPRVTPTCTKPAGLICSTKHTARNAECDSLVTELNGDSTVSVPLSPRQICYEGDAAKQQYCCVSWRDPVANLVKADLAGYANTILQSCTADAISGYIVNAQLEQVCSQVCLSNRGTHCG